MKEIEGRNEGAFTIVPFSSLNPSGMERRRSESWLVHDDGFVGVKRSFVPVRGRVEFSTSAVRGLVRRARLANSAKGVA
ncbi:MAG: hypothetical protein CMB75_02660 [Euryarchaeota archaeon]|nr:hypothetical protein [Euryarchaeota archaeon]